jgi:type I restriction enzyme M protein
VKASLVFLRRFTEADEKAWEAAWAKAHADHDDDFGARREALCTDLGRRVVTGENAKVEAILNKLAKLGVERVTPDWTPGTPPDYPRGIGATKTSKPRWIGTATDAKKAVQLKRDYSAAFDEDMQKRSDVLWRELTAGLRAIDEAHNAALWATVREEFDYLVFVAAPKSVGITSTGETGETVPNELPGLLEAYRAFETWVEAGAKPEDTPGFLLPSTA